MNRIKSTPQDEELMLDEDANSADRSTAAECLASDGFGKQIHPILDKWLNHKDFILRDTAISLLLGAWGHPKYVNKAIDLLHNDSNWSVRGAAARALSDFAKEFVEGEEQEEQIINELIIALFKDNDGFSKQEVYKSLLRIIREQRILLLTYQDSNNFNLQTDVDWNLLQPYLDKYGLQRPM